VILDTRHIFRVILHIDCETVNHKEKNMAEIETSSANWTFLTNHSHVLIRLAQSPDMRMRDLAIEVGITERAIQRIVAELVEAGYLDIIKSGRRNKYITHEEKFLRHPIESHRQVADLIKLINIEAESNQVAKS
jgi:DNA-binding MarR family transcriptional regulator